MGYSRVTRGGRVQSVADERGKRPLVRLRRHWRWWLLGLLVLLVILGLKFLLGYLLRTQEVESVEVPTPKKYVFRPERMTFRQKHVEKKTWQFEYPYDFGYIFAEKENWRMSKEDFLNVFSRVAFQVSSSVDSDLYAFDTKGMTYFFEDVQEARIRFSFGHKSVQRVELVLYGRGNCPEEMPWFEMKRIWKRFDDLRDDDEEMTETLTRDYDKLGCVDMKRWFGCFPAVECACGYKPILIDGEWKSKPDFITVLLSGKRVRRLRCSDYEGFVSVAGYDRDGLHKGDVFIRSVPMVNQGRRGYCAVATMERIMRYYGTDVSMHEFAMLADSDRDKGTSIPKLQKGLDLVCENFGMSWTQHVASASLELNLARKFENVGAVVAIQKKDVAGYSQFTNRVMASIDRGLPVYWSVSHVAPSPDIVLRNDHSRLILGYNEKSEEFLFSDTWGAQHEFKRKGMMDSWIMTKTAWTVDPAARTDESDPDDQREIQANE